MRLRAIPNLSPWALAIGLVFFATLPAAAQEPGTGPPRDLCDVSGLDARLGTMYDTFSITEAPYQDSMGEGLPDRFLNELVGRLCASGDSARIDAATVAFDLNRAALSPLVTTENVLWQNVALLCVFAMSSEGAAGTVLQWLDDGGIDVTGVTFTQVACDGATCLPNAPDDKGAFDVFGVGANPIFSAAGDFDGDGVSNGEEAANIIARGATANDFGDAATDPDSDGTLNGGGGGCAAGAGRGSDSGAPEVFTIVALLGWGMASRKERAS